MLNESVYPANTPIRYKFSVVYKIKGDPDKHVIGEDVNWSLMECIDQYEEMIRDGAEIVSYVVHRDGKPHYCHHTSGHTCPNELEMVRLGIYPQKA